MDNNHEQKPLKWELTLRERNNGSVEFLAKGSRRVVLGVLLTIIVSIMFGWQPQAWVETFLSK